MRITTGSSVSGARGLRVLVVLLALAVVGWGVGYRAELCSGQSLVGHAVPPARMLAHRACPERGLAVAQQAGSACGAISHSMQTCGIAAAVPTATGMASLWLPRGVAQSMMPGNEPDQLGAPRPPPARA